MTAPAPLWAEVGRGYGVRRALAAFVLTRTTRSRAAVMTWLVTAGAVLVLTAGIGGAISMVAPAHNPTLTCSTGLCLGGLGALGLVSSRLDQPPQPATSRRGEPVKAVVTSRAFAYQVENEPARGIPIGLIAQVRWVCGVASVQNRETGRWHLYPAELFPNRDQWRALTRSLPTAATR